MELFWFFISFLELFGSFEGSPERTTLEHLFLRVRCIRWWSTWTSMIHFQKLAGFVFYLKITTSVKMIFASHSKIVQGTPKQLWNVKEYSVILTSFDGMNQKIYARKLISQIQVTFLSSLDNLLWDTYIIKCISLKKEKKKCRQFWDSKENLLISIGV